MSDRLDERIPEIVRTWERANAVMPPADPTDPDDPSTNLATLAAIAHAKWREAEALVEIARAAQEYVDMVEEQENPAYAYGALRAALARLDTGQGQT